MSAVSKQKCTLEEYLELDRNSDERLEYRDGEVFSMSGVSKEHDQIEGNLYFHLRSHLAGRNCRVFLANMRLKVPSLPPYRYGDISALCGQPHFEPIGGVEVLNNPSLIIEVLSRSTEAYDRGKKFQLYLNVDSLQEYVLISQDQAQIERYLRQPRGEWLFARVIGLDATIELNSIQCTLALADVYDKISFEPDEAAPPT